MKNSKDYEKFKAKFGSEVEFTDEEIMDELERQLLVKDDWIKRALPFLLFIDKHFEKLNTSTLPEWSRVKQLLKDVSSV